MKDMVIKVKNLFIATGSITWAMRVRDLLRKNGYKAEAEKNTSFSGNGCGYGVAVYGDKETVADFLENYPVKINEIYEL